MNEPLSPATAELLEWVARRPRTYSEAIEAWRSNCPRLSAWDDALTGGLLQVSRAQVTLTAQGRALLNGAPHAARAARSA